MFAKDLFTNFAAAFLPSSDVLGVARSLWFLAALGLASWCWKKYRIVGPPAGGSAKVIYPVIFIAVGMISLLGGLLWLQTLKPVAGSDIAGLSNANLSSSAITFAARLRTFSGNSERNEPASDPLPRAPRDPTPEQLKEYQDLSYRLWQEDNERKRQHRVVVQTEFLNEYLPTAKEYKTQIEKRLRKIGKFPPYVEQNPQSSIGISTLDTGMLAGPSPMVHAADYIHAIARLLPAD